MQVGDLVKDITNGWMGIVTYIDHDNNVPLYCIAYPSNPSEDDEWLEALHFEVISASR